MSANSLAAFWTPATREVCNHLWQSTVFASVVWLLTLLLRRHQARTRYWLWMAASAKFLVPFSLLIALGGHLSWIHRPAQPQTAAYIAINTLSQPFSDATELGGSTIFSGVQPTLSHNAIALLPALLAMVWLCGFITVLAFWCVQLRRISKATRAAKPLLEGREVEMLRRVEQAAAIRRETVILSFRNSMEPGVFGIFHPVLLWPEGISRHLNDAHLEAVLAHEVCHVQRRDNLTSVIHMLVEAAFWFHPLVWWMQTQLVEERERACDEAVLQLCNQQPQVYAESILKICELCLEPPLPCVSGITGANLKKRIANIMSDRIGLVLSRGKMAALVTVGLVSVIGPVALGVVHGVALYGQMLHTTGPRPSFEVATIKPSKPDENRDTTMMSRSEFAATHQSLWSLIRSAYGIKLDEQITGGPSWTASQYFDILAKPEPSEIEYMKQNGVSVMVEQSALMLQSLLADRFQLKVSFKTEELPAYALVIDKGNPKLKEVAVAPQFTSEQQPIPSPPAPPPPGSSNNSSHGPLLPPEGFPGFRVTGPHQVTATAVRMSWLTEWLLGPSGRPVIDQTGLKGNYDFVLDGISGEPGTAPPDEFTISVFTALQQQLGLKLVPIKAPVEVLVIDHVERPSPN